jgi:hypothetical protein
MTNSNDLVVSMANWPVGVPTASTVLPGQFWSYSRVALTVEILGWPCPLAPIVSMAVKTTIILTIIISIIIIIIIIIT